MINEIKSLIQDNTLVLEKVISDNLSPVSIQEQISFQRKLNHFIEDKCLSNLDKDKFKVYAKINKGMQNEDNSIADCKNVLNFYYPFLINLYAAKENGLSNQERFKFAIHNFVKDIQLVTQKYIETPNNFNNHINKVS